MSMQSSILQNEVPPENKEIVPTSVVRDTSTALLFDEPGPIALRRIRIANICGTILLLVLAGLVLLRLSAPPGGQNQLSPSLWIPALNGEAWLHFYLHLRQPSLPSSAHWSSAYSLAWEGSHVLGQSGGSAPSSLSSAVRCRCFCS